MSLGRVLRLAPWVIIGLVVAVAMVIGAHRSASPASIDARARTIAAGVRCPTCAGESAADSQVYAAKAIRTDITQRLHAGQSDRQIRAYLVSRYGPGILESPPARGFSLLVWVLPAVIVPTATVLLVLGFRRARGGPLPPISDDDRAVVADALGHQPPPLPTPASEAQDEPESRRPQQPDPPPSSPPQICAEKYLQGCAADGSDRHEMTGPGPGEEGPSPPAGTARPGGTP